MGGLEACNLWEINESDEVLQAMNGTYENLPEHFSKREYIRLGGIREIRLPVPGPCPGGECEFETHVLFNDNFTVSYT